MHKYFSSAVHPLLPEPARTDDALPTVIQCWHVQFGNVQAADGDVVGLGGGLQALLVGEAGADPLGAALMKFWTWFWFTGEEYRSSLYRGDDIIPHNTNRYIYRWIPFEYWKDFFRNCMGNLFFFQLIPARRSMRMLLFFKFNSSMIDKIQHDLPCTASPRLWPVRAWRFPFPRCSWAVWGQLPCSRGRRRSGPCSGSRLCAPWVKRFGVGFSFSS